MILLSRKESFQLLWKYDVKALDSDYFTSIKKNSDLQLDLLPHCRVLTPFRLIRLAGHHLAATTAR